MAKISGVKVEEFGFGIPPRVWGRKIRGTVYSINLLPIGGFVRLKGEEEETWGLGDVDSFTVQGKLRRIGIIAGGVLGNLILAWLAFSLLWGVGIPVSAGKVAISEVSAGSPASAAGISVGDDVLSLNGEPTKTADALSSLIEQKLGKQVTLEVERNGVVRKISLLARTSPPEGEGPLGIVITTAFKDRTSVV
jgi:regulator of sigma E protease